MQTHSWKLKQVSQTYPNSLFKLFAEAVLALPLPYRFMKSSFTRTRKAMGVVLPADSTATTQYAETSNVERISNEWIKSGNINLSNTSLLLVKKLIRNVTMILSWTYEQKLLLPWSHWDLGFVQARHEITTKKHKPCVDHNVFWSWSWSWSYQWWWSWWLIDFHFIIQLPTFMIFFYSFCYFQLKKDENEYLQISILMLWNQTPDEPNYTSHKITNISDISKTIHMNSRTTEKILTNIWLM